MPVGALQRRGSLGAWVAGGSLDASLLAAAWLPAGGRLLGASFAPGWQAGQALICTLTCTTAGGDRKEATNAPIAAKTASLGETSAREPNQAATMATIIVNQSSWVVTPPPTLHPYLSWRE